MEHNFDFLANTADGVFVVDADQSILFWNKPATEILGHRSREVIGKPCHEVLQGNDLDGCTICRRDCKAIVAARKSTPVPTVDMSAVGRNGEEIGLSVTTVIVPSPDKKANALVHLFRERTRQQELLKALGEFNETVSGVSGKGHRRPARASRNQSGAVELTPREKQILGRLVTGESTESIAGRLGISPRTVRNHVTNILAKLGVHSRLEAVTWSMRNGLL